MVIFIILTVFIAGLMVGRTPEYLGKKVEAFEVKMAILAILAPSAVILLFSAVAAACNTGLSSLNNTGPHGLSEIMYAFSSAAGNNGSAFAGLNANTVFYNLLLGTGMLIGRFGVIIPILAIAGNMDITGYQVVSCILLFMVSILALFYGTGPILYAAALSALIWDYFFIPPQYTFLIQKPLDILLLIMKQERLSPRYTTNIDEILTVKG